MNWRAHIASIAVSLGFSTMGSGATIDQNWDSRFDLAPGLNGRVFTMLGWERISTSAGIHRLYRQLNGAV
jgi:hypothetical protein